MHWLCVNDFNKLLFCRKKVGGFWRSATHMDAFRTILQSYELGDFGCSNEKFAWSNNKMDGTVTVERLDRVIATKTSVRYVWGWWSLGVVVLNLYILNDILCPICSNMFTRGWNPWSYSLDLSCCTGCVVIGQ